MLFTVLFLLLIPIYGFQKNYSILNMLIDLPIFVILNIILCLFFLESEIRKYRHQSLFMLDLACVTVFAAFLRMIPLPAGLTLSFLIPICSGIVFGPIFGFLVGQLSMFIGGMMMGALGPWLPFQCFMMGFLAYYAGAFFENKKSKTGILIYVSIASLLYGYWLSTTYWPLTMENHVMPDSFLTKLESYTQYYVVTSLLWDLTRVVGNIFIFGILYEEVFELLSRGQRRLSKV